jgi:polysaccharide pyruvyl transferase WcaK-like protein
MLDPGINENGETFASNLGDIIISRAIYSNLVEMFPGKKIVRIPSHYKISKKNAKLLKGADKVFISGTNLLSSNYKQLNRPLGPLSLSKVFNHNIRNSILFGVGWGYGYEERLTKTTEFIYKHFLFSKNSIHSVRDSYSESKLNSFLKVNNTNCPTMWKLNGLEMDLSKKNNSKTCLFTLTDYLKDYDKDDQLIDFLIKKFDRVVFFPQGKWDLQYINLLPSYVKNKFRIEVLERDIDAYDKFVIEENFIYIGTRLHGGIRCHQEKKPAYIITIDNRARDIAKDTNLASGERGDLNLIDAWLTNKTSFGRLHLNLIGIDSFLNAYK